MPVIDKARKNIKDLQDLNAESNPSSMSDTFTQALTGFLPLIAGAIAGGVEGVAATAPVAQAGLNRLAEQSNEEKARNAVIVNQGLGLAKAEEANTAAQTAASTKAAATVTAQTAAEAGKTARQAEALKAQKEIANTKVTAQKAIAGANIEASAARTGAQIKSREAVAAGAPARAVNTAELKKVSDWKSNGMTTVNKSIATLERARDNLKANPDLSGGLTGALPDRFTSSEVLGQRSEIAQAAIGALQAFKGSTSDKELEAAVRTVYNEKADAATNIKTLNNRIQELKNQAASMNHLVSKVAPKPIFSAEQIKAEIARRAGAKK